MWPDTTISDDRRAGSADWTQQVSARWTRGLSKQSQRLEPSDELMQARTRQLPPAGKCPLDNTQTWPGLLISPTGILSDTHVQPDKIYQQFPDIQP